VKIAGLALAALLVAGCSKNIQNADAVRQGVMDHLTGRPDIGLNLDAMNIVVSNVSFREGEADAVVAFQPKGRPEGSGMSMNYKLRREGDKWVVKDKSMVGGSPAGAASNGTPGADAPPAMPPGHMPVAPPAAGK
jgi:hypothetical protein